MKRRILTIFLVMLITMFPFTVIGFANPVDGVRGGERGCRDFLQPEPKHFGLRILFDKELNLTQEQKDKIFSLIIQSKQKRDSITTELLKVRYEKENELSKPNPNFAKVKSLNSRIASLKKDLIESRENLKLDILSVLTPDQRQKLQERYFRKGWERMRKGF